MNLLLSLFEGKNIALELFGYFGTGLVLLSFLMRDIKWLRIINIAGGLISLIYAILVNTMPVVVLNGSLITINLIQLITTAIKEREDAIKVNSEDTCAYDNTEKEKEENI